MLSNLLLLRLSKNTVTVVPLDEHFTFIKFLDTMCFLRSLRISYDSSTSVRDIDLYRYIVRKEELLNGNVNPNNKGFCVTGPTKACLPTGLLDVMNCRGGSTGKARF